MDDLYELIEAYLNDDLTADQRQDVERRMAQDPAFQDEVALHRQLQEAYADPGRLHLREVLAEIMDEPAPLDKPPPQTPDKPKQGSRKTWMLIAVVLLTGAGFWFFSRPITPTPIPEGDLPAAPKPALPTPETPTANDPQPSRKSEPSRPIALADPANFAPHPAMEASVNGLVRSADGMQVAMAAPKNGTPVQPNADGTSAVRFAGRLEGAAPDDILALSLLIFNNRDDQNPLLTQSVPLRTDTAGRADFDRTLRLSVPRGLYYFRLEESKSAEMLMAGKFIVGRL